MFHGFDIGCTILIIITTAGLTAGRIGCPNGQPVYNCLRSPCSVSSCPAFPGAECRDDYCGGCNARYYVNNRQVNCASSGAVSRRKREEHCPFVKCPPPDIPCPHSPCANQHCPAYPSALCCHLPCDPPCSFSWYVGNQDVTEDCWNVDPNPQPEGPLNPIT
ncbi:uncharacterized protein LOC129594003 [Paramacrobiotus metropolitanus]|uniref:uncharacterized protein LOC129594003 n=1 Tax=Paramacrobiotus metropolitanus TaxID=2943436 RepID=UPI0024461DD3|nr:uncharacterized protein LOC129594003 [Paramacrobiotus metropolitanus]